MANRKMVMELAPLLGPKKEEEMKDKLMDEDEKEMSLSSMFEKGVKEAEDTYPSQEPKFPKVVKENEDKEMKVKELTSMVKKVMLMDIDTGRVNPQQALEMFTDITKAALGKSNVEPTDAVMSYVRRQLEGALEERSKQKKGSNNLKEKYPEKKDYPSSQGKYPANASEAKTGAKAKLKEKYPEKKDYPSSGGKYPAKVSESKNLKEAVPPSKREIAIKQQEADMQKLLAQEEQLQKQLQQVQVQKDALNKRLVLGPAPQQTSISQVNQELGQAKFGMLNRESKNESLTITKTQFKEAIRKGVQINERKKFIYETVKAQIADQVETRNLIESYLTEGPLSTAFAGLKGAAQGAVSGAKSAFGQTKQAFSQAAAAQQAKDAQSQALKQAQKSVADAMKNVSSTRNKFSQEILKNAGLVNQYHDAVVALKQAADQAKQSLSQPEAQRIDSEATVALGQLYQDLNSEKSGIDVFLKDLEKKIGKDKLLMTRTKAVLDKAQKNPDAGVYGVGKGPNRAGLRSPRGGGGSGLL
jgi:hypothetical protein